MSEAQAKRRLIEKGSSSLHQSPSEGNEDHSILPPYWLGFRDRCLSRLSYDLLSIIHRFIRTISVRVYPFISATYPYQQSEGSRDECEDCTCTFAAPEDELIFHHCVYLSSARTSCGPHSDGSRRIIRMNWHYVLSTGRVFPCLKALPQMIRLLFGYYKKDACRKICPFAYSFHYTQSPVRSVREEGYEITFPHIDVFSILPELRGGFDQIVFQSGPKLRDWHCDVVDSDKKIYFAKFPVRGVHSLAFSEEAVFEDESRVFPLLHACKPRVLSLKSSQPISFDALEPLAELQQLSIGANRDALLEKCPNLRCLGPSSMLIENLNDQLHLTLQTLKVGIVRPGILCNLVNVEKASFFLDDAEVWEDLKVLLSRERLAILEVRKITQNLPDSADFVLENASVRSLLLSVGVHEYASSNFIPFLKAFRLCSGIRSIHFVSPSEFSLSQFPKLLAQFSKLQSLGITFCDDQNTRFDSSFVEYAKGLEHIEVSLKGKYPIDKGVDNLPPPFQPFRFGDQIHKNVATFATNMNLVWNCQIMEELMDLRTVDAKKKPRSRPPFLTIPEFLATKMHSALSGEDGSRVRRIKVDFVSRIGEQLFVLDSAAEEAILEFMKKHNLEEFVCRIDNCRSVFTVGYFGGG